MRKIIAGLFISLDGVAQGPGPEDEFEQAGWTMPYYSDAIGQVIGENIARSDALLLGRVTYQGFESSFANQTDGMAMALNNQNKYVASTTLKKATWNNSTLISDNVIETIAKLKQQPGKDIAMSGSIGLVQSLALNGLIDEYSLLVYPVILGMGKRLFPDGLKATLKLIEAKPLGAGVVHMHYETDSQA